MTDLLLTALSQYGVKEVVGAVDNPTIVNYFKEIGHSWVKDDETAWCSAFINWCALKAGYERSGKLNARSWLTIGTKLNEYSSNSKDLAQPGDVVVFWRISPTSEFGHVALLVCEDSQDTNYIWVLGGNQSNQVSIEKMPKSKVLGVIRLNKV